MTCSIIILAASIGFSQAYDDLPHVACLQPRAFVEAALRFRTCWRRPIPEFAYAMVPPKMDTDYQEWSE